MIVISEEWNRTDFLAVFFVSFYVACCLNFFNDEHENNKVIIPKNKENVNKF